MIRSSFRISHAAVARDFTYRVAAELGGSGIASGGPAPGTPPLGAGIGQDLDIYGLRAQYSF